MLIRFDDIKKITFPVYILPSDDWYVTDKVLFLGDKVLDERNMPGKSLGVRRIQCRRTDLVPLRKALFSLPELIQCKTKYFIDSKGKPFVYMKSYRSKLKTYRIKKIELKDTASLLWLYDIPYPITLQRPPLDDPTWVRMLHYNNEPWMVYDYVRLPVKDTYRRV